jgi:adenylate cyclase class 1
VKNIEIDQKQLKNIRNHFLKLVETRLGRIESGLSSKQADYLKILPLLFHVNHPLLPGYVDKLTPCGISNYNPSSLQKMILKSLTKSFTFIPRAQFKYQISSLYLMGSMGTLGQSGDSDIDLWICLDEVLDKNMYEKLVKKATKIKGWYALAGIELNFYIVNSNDFKTNKKKIIGVDNCGNTQKYLLLDEFYRTSIWLAGKWPLWWLVPVNEDYEEYASRLLKQKHVDAYEWIDFGEVKEVPPNEYLSAAIWQLYKSIESPYKSFVKLLVLETYAKNYPCKGLLSNDLKHKLFCENKKNKELDPYLQMMIFIEEHLVGQSERLDFFRKSFYLKSHIKINFLKKETTNWKYSIMLDLVSSWGWQQEQLNNLNKRSRWNVNNVIEERKVLIKELTDSYHFLSSFYRHHEQQSAFKNNEIVYLGRKLHASFERRSGKIEIVNNAIAKKINESAVTLVENNGSWDLYIGHLNSTQLISSKVSFRGFSLFESLCWGAANDVIVSATRYQIVSDNGYFNDHLVSQISKDIIGFLKVDEKQYIFNKPSSEKILGVFINTRFDPLIKDKNENVYRVLTGSDLLSSKDDMSNLASHFDMICINSWGEITTKFYSGDTAWIDFFQRYKSVFKSQKKPCYLYCRGLAQNDAIINRVDEILNKWRLLYINSLRSDYINRYVMMIGKSRMIVDFYGDDIFYNTFQSINKYYNGLSKSHFLEKNVRSIKAKIDSHYSLEPFVQTVLKRRLSGELDCFVYQKSNTIIEFMVKSANGLIHFTTHKNISFKQLISHYQHFFDKVRNRNLQVNEGFKETNFYECIFISKSLPLKIKPINIKEKEHYQQFSLVQAIATHHSPFSLGFDLFTATSSFYYMNDGEDVYQKMRNQLISLRKNSLNYPIFITDLDLSAKLEKVTLMELLSYKQIIESKINNYKSLNSNT